MKFNVAIVAVLGLLASAHAFAQDAAPTPAPTETPAPAAQPAAVTVPSKFTLEVDVNDLNSISTALNELPKKIADPLINKLNAQIQAQVKSERK